MSDVMQMARVRRQEFVDAIAEMEAEIAQLDTFLAIGEGLLDDNGEAVEPVEAAPALAATPTPDVDDTSNVRDESDMESDLESDMKAARAIREIMPLPASDDLGPEYDMYSDQ